MISPDLTVTHLQPIAIPDDRMRADATCHVTDVSAERGARSGHNDTKSKTKRET